MYKLYTYNFHLKEINLFHKFCIDNNIREIQTFQDRIPNTQDHTRALKYIYETTFQENIKNMNIPFEKPGTSEFIKKILESADLNRIMAKYFFDIHP